MSGKTEKLPSWRPQGIPMDEPERAAYRQLAVEAVFSVWNEEHRPAQLKEIYIKVQEKIQTLSTLGQWPYHYRSKRSIDRRVNEAASPAYCEGKSPRIVAVTAGIYQPCPALFEPPKLKQDAGVE